MKPRSMKQKWVYERLFHSAGVMARTVGALTVLLYNKALLPDEEEKIKEALLILRQIKIRQRKEESFKQFCNRSMK